MDRSRRGKHNVTQPLTEKPYGANGSKRYRPSHAIDVSIK